MKNSNSIPKSDTCVPVIITEQSIATAEQFAMEQHTKEKYQQVYLNTLAVYLVNNYLRIMGISTDLAAGDSWNPLIRFAANVADLEITGVGRLECLPLINQSEKCHVPLEVMDDRIGYVVVDIDLEQNLAYLLGFVEQVATEDLSLSQLLPIENLLPYISELKEKTPIIKLAQWLNHTFESGWQLLSEILANPYQELTVSFRDTDTISRGKRLNLIQGKQAVALCVSVNAILNSEMAISVSLYPIAQQVLPAGVQLILLDEQEKLEMQAEAGKHDESLKFKFTGELKETFSIKVCWGNVQIIETFIVD